MSSSVKHGMELSLANAMEWFDHMAETTRLSLMRLPASLLLQGHPAHRDRLIQWMRTSHQIALSSQEINHTIKDFQQSVLPRVAVGTGSSYASPALSWWQRDLSSLNQPIFRK